jgi:adenine/guanine phosphoribosyltransferase-like PRPP-binding protein
VPHWNGQSEWVEDAQPNDPPEVNVVDPPGMRDIVRMCALTRTMRDRDGRETTGGFINLKRLFGRPDALAGVVRELAKTVEPNAAVAAADEGAWPLVGALALSLRRPAIFVRRDPKRYFVSYGDDDSLGDGRLVGEHLEAGAVAHLVDDVIYSGETMVSAIDALGHAGLVVKTASCVVGAGSRQRVAEILSRSGLERVYLLVATPDLGTLDAT